jgi:hypothetical protein
MWNADTLPSVSDPEMPAVSLLLSHSAIEVLEAALEPEEAVISGFRPTRASYLPGRRIAVSYDVALRWGSGAANETVVAMAHRDGPPEGAVTVDAAGGPVAVWRLPKDPYLPGFQLATDPAFVRELLDQIGAPPGDIELQTRSYWPRWRAVIEVTTTPSAAGERLVFRPGRGFERPKPTSVVYLKVVRPDRVAKLRRTHELLSGIAPIADCQYCSEQDGLMVLESLPGETLWQCVRRPNFPPPDGRDLMALLTSVEQADVQRSRRMTSRESARLAAALLSAILPTEAGRLDRFIDALGEDPDEPLITIHGDFHEVQVLVDRDGICGLLDLDDVGPGQRIDDLAMMAGRFWSFAPFEKRGRERIAQYALDLLESFAAYADPEDLHQRVACVLLARATSPFRSQAPNWPRNTRRAIELAERWLDRSGRGIATALSV